MCSMVVRLSGRNSASSSLAKLEQIARQVDPSFSAEGFTSTVRKRVMYGDY